MFQNRPSSLAGRVAAVALALGAAVAPALAQSGPPALPAITMPIDTASVVAVVVAAGVAILILWVPAKLGFGFAKRLISRVFKSVA